MGWHAVRPRFPALDGVRALAIIGVLAAHAGVPWASGGFLGVDVFFVLSGFLITSLLLDEWRRTGAVNLPAFWAPRVRRLLPGGLAMVIAVVVGAGLFRPDTVAQLRSTATWAVLWSGNWRWALGGTDYFAQGGTASPLQHTWSLAVEEQFYLVWPLLLAWLWRAGVGSARRRLFQAATGLAAASAVETALLVRSLPLGRVYFGTDTRAQELCIGAALAAILAPTWAWAERRRVGRSPQPCAARSVPLVCATVGLLGLLVLGHRATGTVTEFRAGLMLLCAALSAALIAGLVLDAGHVVSRLFATGPMRYLGRISYGTYLWHWPTFQILDGERTHLGPAPLAVLRVTVGIALGAASTALVEDPLRRSRWSSRRVLQGAAIAAVGALTFVACAAPTPPSAPSNLTAPGLDAPPTLPATSRPSSSTSTSSPIVGSQTTKAPTPGSPTAATRPPGRAHAGPVRIDVFGDSIGWTLVRYLPATPGFRFTDRTELGCGIVQGGPYRYFGAQYPDRRRCDTWPTGWAQHVRADRPDVVLLVVGRWETMDRVHGGSWTHVGDPGFDAYLAGELGQAIQVLGGTGASVVVSDEPYNRRGEQPSGQLYPEDQPARVDAWNKIVRSVLAAHSRSKLLPLNRKLCPDGRFTWTVAGRQVRSDGVHLTPAGVAWLTPWMLASLRHG